APRRDVESRTAVKSLRERRVCLTRTAPEVAVRRRGGGSRLPAAVRGRRRWPAEFRRAARASGAPARRGVWWIAPPLAIHTRRQSLLDGIQGRDRAERGTRSVRRS